jgi:hypothetical protein
MNCWRNDLISWKPLLLGHDINALSELPLTRLAWQPTPKGQRVEEGHNVNGGSAKPCFLCVDYII